MTKKQNGEFFKAMLGMGLVIVGIGYCQRNCREKPASVVVAKDTNPFPVPQDDAELMMAKFGIPDVDDTTDTDKPRPPLVTRLLTYKSTGVKAAFLCGGKIGDPPPCGNRWGLIGFTDVESKVALTFEEAMTKMKPLLRDDAPQKRFKTAGHDAQVKKLDDEIAKLKSIIRQVEYRERAAEVQVYPGVFLGLPMSSKRNLCNLVLQRARLTNDNVVFVVRVTDYRTEKDLGACDDMMPFTMAD